MGPCALALHLRGLHDDGSLHIGTSPQRFATSRVLGKGWSKLTHITFGNKNVERKRCTYDVTFTSLTGVCPISVFEQSQTDVIRISFTFYFLVTAPMGSFRFDDGWILRRLNSNFIHVRMRQICPPSFLPMLQHAKGLTTVVVRTQRLVSYRRRSGPSCKSKSSVLNTGYVR